MGCGNRNVIAKALRGHPSIVALYQRQGRMKEIRLSGQCSEILSIAISKDKQHVVSGSWDSAVRAWNVSTGR